MRHSTWLAALTIALASIAGPATAQEVEAPRVPVVKDLARDLGLSEPPRNGHDKCKGKGHEKHEASDGGHDEGECDESQQEPGPVASEVCGAGELAEESAWQRYSCTVATYNEAYIAEAIAANESYPERLAEYATAEAAVLQAATTTYAGAAVESVSAGNVDGLVAATDSFLGVSDRYLPSTPLPAPGPVIDDLNVYSETMIRSISSGDVGGAVATTQTFLGGVDRYLPSTPLPAPGPVIDDLNVYSETMVRSISSGDVGGAVTTTRTYLGGVTQYLPSTPLPAPGPVIDDLNVYSEAMTAAVRSGDVGGSLEATQTFFNGSDRYLPSTPLPAPGPVIDDYNIQMPSGF